MDVREVYHQLRRAYWEVQDSCNRISTVDSASSTASANGINGTSCPGLQALRFSLTSEAALNHTVYAAAGDTQQGIQESTSVGGIDAFVYETPYAPLINNNTTPDDSLPEEGLALVIQVYAALETNITILTNVTTDHAAPVFLKELSPLVYANLLEQQAQGGSGIQIPQAEGNHKQASVVPPTAVLPTARSSDGNATQWGRAEDDDDLVGSANRYVSGRLGRHPPYSLRRQLGAGKEPNITYGEYVQGGPQPLSETLTTPVYSKPHYRLYSHPLAEANLQNEVYIQRGYVLYIIAKIGQCNHKVVGS